MNNRFFFIMKLPIIVFLIGLCIRLVGRMMMIMHWPFSRSVAITGIVIMIMSAAWAIMRIFNQKSPEH